jgi:hypothetical protein
MSAMTCDSGDFVTHCRCTLSQEPTPHKAFVENKDQSAIQPSGDRAVEVPFRCFSASESCLFESHHLTPDFTQLQWNQHAFEISQFSSAESIGRGSQPQKCKTQPQAGSENNLWTAGALACDFSFTPGL